MGGTSLTAIALGQFRRSHVGLVGAALVCAFVLVAALAPLLSPYDPVSADFANVLSPPTRAHPFGTDDIGRDILSRVVYGSRISLQAGLFTVAVALCIGLPLGLVAGYLGGRVDNVIMRGLEVVLAFPGLVLALGITAVLGPKLIHALFAIGVVFVPNFARLIRAQVLSVKEHDFVSAARALGASDRRLVILHILPNCLAPLLVQSSFSVAFGILTEAALSFLGMGTQPRHLPRRARLQPPRRRDPRRPRSSSQDLKRRRDPPSGSVARGGRALLLGVFVAGRGRSAARTL